MGKEASNDKYQHRAEHEESNITGDHRRYDNYAKPSHEMYKRKPYFAGLREERTLAAQLGKDGITVNCIHPGPTRTERFAQRAQQEGLTLEEYERRGFQSNLWSNFNGRVVDASEIAYLAVFLCSDKAGAITGEVIEASGGVGVAVHY